MSSPESSPVFVLIPAAGSGTRMQSDMNKQLLSLAGRSVIARTLDIFERHPQVEGMILIAAEKDLPAFYDLISRNSWSRLLSLTTGGATRQESVYNGLQALSRYPGCHDMSPVLVHDGARCLVDPGTIDRVIAGIRQHQACGAAMPVKDTIKLAARDGKVIQTPDRNCLWAMQTPQGGIFRLLLAAYDQATRDGRLTTDDLAVLELAGQAVYLVEGNENNIKLTTPQDWLLAEQLSRRQTGGTPEPKQRTDNSG